MIFERDYKVEVRDISIDKKATNKALMKYLEAIACSHSDEVGYGIYGIDTKKVVWILLDWKVKILERPNYSQKVHVKTWSRKIDKCCAYRDFQIYDENNKLLVIATSKWVLLDADSRKIMKITDEVIKGYYTEQERHVFEEEIEKVHEPEKYENSLQIKVRRSDIDINNHVNNLNYLDLAYEVVPQQIYEKDLKNIRITYKHQTEPNEIVNLYYTNENEKNIVTIKNLDNTKLHSIIELW